MRTAALLGTITLLLAAGPAARPYGGHLPGAAEDLVAVTQVFDRMTGRPVEGVTVRQYEEDGTIGFLGAELLAETVTDSFGLASVEWRTAPYDCHWVFDAEGYAVAEVYGEFPRDRVWLTPKGKAITGRLLDPFGEPAAGVEIELIVGCGHSPAVRRVRTGPDGRFRIEGVAGRAGQLWCRLPGADWRYESVAYDHEEQGDIVPLPGVVVSGVVVDVEGEPVEGAVVTSLQCHRGPATVTGPDGRFRLAGADPGDAIAMYHDRYRGYRVPFFTEETEDLFPWGRPPVPVRVVLPPNDDLEQDDLFEERLVTVPLEVVGADPEEHWVRLFDMETGRSFTNAGESEIRVLPGTYRLLPGDPFQAVRDVSPEEVVVREHGTPPLVVRTEPRPALQVVAKEIPENATLNLVLPGAARSFELPTEEPVHLPANVRAVVRVDTPYHTLVCPVGPVANGARRVEIHWRAPSLPAPDPEEMPLDVGPVLLVDGRGNPIVGRPVRIIRDRSRAWGKTDEEGCARRRGSWPAETRAAVIELTGYAPRMLVIEKSGPVTVRYADGGIRLSVADEEGAPIDFAYCLDGMTGLAEGGEIELRGVDPGEHRLIVDAKGRAARLLTVEVPADGLRDVAVTLPRER